MTLSDQLVAYLGACHVKGEGNAAHRLDFPLHVHKLGPRGRHVDASPGKDVLVVVDRRTDNPGG